MTGRAGRKPEPPTEYDNPNCGGRFPEKQPLRHRWMIGVMYSLSEAQASAVSHGARVNLDQENRVSMTMGCWDCERDYDDVAADPCRATARPD